MSACARTPVAPIEARAYQTKAIDSGRAAFRAGKRAVLFVAPTGAGKTTIFSMMAASRVAKGGRVAVFAHRIELVDQAVARLRAFGLHVGCNGSGLAAPVQVTTIQTVLARKKMPDADLVIFDEAHHVSGAEEWERIPRTFAERRVPIVGFTATPERADGIGLAGIFDELIVVAQIAELTALGYLVECEIMNPRTSPKALAMEPWDAYRQHAGGRPAVVFAPHVKAAHSFADDFRANDIAAGVVHSASADCDRRCAEMRSRTLDAFAAGEINVLVNVNVLTEGWDCARAKVCILARRVGSPSQYLQMGGRVLRPDGTGPALLIDLAGNVELHGTLDEERVYRLEGAACTRLSEYRDGVRICRACKAEIPPNDSVCPACGSAPPPMLTPTAEGIALQRFLREEARAKLPEDRRVKILASLYAKALRKGHKRAAAEYAYRGMFKQHPPTIVSVTAWARAQEIVAREKGDAWLPTG